MLLPCILAISLGMPIIYPGNLENVFSLVLQNVNCVPRDSEHLSLTEAPTCVSVHYLLITGCVGVLLLCYFWRDLFGWVFLILFLKSRCARHNYLRTLWLSQLDAKKQKHFRLLFSIYCALRKLQRSE